MGAAHPISEPPVILFDGVCNLCNGAVTKIIRFDKNSIFKFAPLQSSFAKEQLQRLGLPSTEFDSIVLLKNGMAFYKSDAAIEIAKNLSGLWFLATLFKIFPQFLRNIIYDFIARNRYAFFGRKEQCMIPTLELKARFLS